MHAEIPEFKLLCHLRIPLPIGYNLPGNLTWEPGFFF